jgi:predicted nucleotidyltransferase/DNA-binding transcriptional ArsR family regulator
VALPPGTEAVIRALAGTVAPLGVRELARVAGVSANRASQVLSHLIEHGLVTVEEHGAGRLCRLNRAHLATEPLLALVGLRGRLLEFLRQDVGSWKPHALHVSLFGSTARGDGGTGSDLDLLVVRTAESKQDHAWEDQLDAAAQRILAATGNPVSWMVVSPADLARAVEAGEPIVDEWRRDAIHLTGKRLDHLLREAAV